VASNKQRELLCHDDDNEYFSLDDQFDACLTVHAVLFAWSHCDRNDIPGAEDWLQLDSNPFILRLSLCRSSQSSPEMTSNTYT